MPESLHNHGDIGLYIATHDQPVEFSEQEKLHQDILIPIQAGAALSSKKLCSVRDDSGENISEKNESFCELTVLYWIWKNDKHAIKGLSHYRRRFMINEERIANDLKLGDIIIPPSWYFRESLGSEYSKYHKEKDIELLKEVVHTVSPEFDDSFSRTLRNNELVPYNMLIAREEVLDDYCEWLFEILFELEGSLQLDQYDTYQRRVFGFLSERLFTVYLEKQSLKRIVCPITSPDQLTVLKRLKYQSGKIYNRAYFKWVKHERS